MGIGKWLIKKIVRSNTRGMCRALLIGFLAAENYHKSGKMPDVKHYSDFIIFAMQNRSGWEQIKDDTFEHKKTGEKITISKNDILKNIAAEVAMIEINYQIAEQPRSDRQELLNESQKVVAHFFN